MSNHFARSFFICVLLFSAAGGFSQNLKWGVKGGLSLPNLPSSGGSEVSKGYKSISGPDIALITDYTIAENLSIETGLEWSTQGGEKTGLQTIPASQDLAQYFPPGSNVQFLYANFTSTIRLQYLMLPVLVKYTMDLGNQTQWKLYWDAGFFGGLLMTARASAAGTSKVYYDQEETMPVGAVSVQFDSTGDIKNQLHKGNFGLEANVGLLYQFKTMSVFAEAGGNYGFISLQKDSRNGVNHTGALNFRIGILFGLYTRQGF